MVNASARITIIVHDVCATEVVNFKKLAGPMR
jgi:hypothetical protein